MKYVDGLIVELSTPRQSESGLLAITTYSMALWTLLRVALKGTRFKPLDVSHHLSNGFYGELEEEGTPFVYEITITVRKK
jgi:hypothetical protein